MVGKLCIDSGGTKIKYRYIQGDKVVDESVVYQNGNIFTNYDNILAIYCKIIEQYSDVKLDVLIGAAGAISAKDLLADLISHLLTLDNVKHVEIISDIELIAIANKSASKSLLFAFGTGSIGVIQKHKEIQVFGGYGYLLGDQGSGYCFGSHLLRTYFIDYDLNNHYPYTVKLTNLLGASEPRAILKLIANSQVNIISSLTKAFIDDPDFEVITDEFIKELIQYMIKFRLKYRIYDIKVFGSLTKSQKVQAALEYNDFKLAENSSLDAIYSYKFKEKR